MFVDVPFVIVGMNVDDVAAQALQVRFRLSSDMGMAQVEDDVWRPLPIPVKPLKISSSP